MKNQKYAEYLNRVSVFMVAETMSKYRVQDSNHAAKLLQDYMRYYDREHMVALCLDKKGQIQSIHEISVGTLDKALAHPREVFKAAILANAAAIILAHNHPSGYVEPSDDDILLTERLREAGDIIGIEVKDHLIIGSNSYYSFAENGLIN